MKAETEMLKNKAIRTAALAACITLFGGTVSSVVAAPKGATTVNPFTLQTVPVAQQVAVVALPVFVPAAVPFASNAPGKGPPVTASPGAPPPAQFTGGGSPVPPPAPAS